MANAWVLSMDGQIMALYSTHQVAVQDREVLKKIHPNSSFDIENWCVNNEAVYFPVWNQDSNTLEFNKQ